ncbi:MAG TPA: acetyl-CoA carboxylase carboxyltransferase subunit beta [Clostridiaceae bacterium]|nr:acetyl-CoA carboxylase carboxyltransferase subunit beta [Clostridiaceae bacterium]
MQQAEVERRTVRPGDSLPRARAYAYRQPIPDDLWIKCPECGGVMFRDDFNENKSVCTFCKFHFRINARERLAAVVDPHSFTELDAGMSTLNPLDHEGYETKIQSLQQRTGLCEGVITGVATIQGWPVVIGAMDSRFLMGSMGSVVGEKITRCFEYATSHSLPVILFTASGGARMQEGIISLMQMTKTSAAVGRHHDAGLLYISVMTDPTTGGVTASFASLGDIIIAEPGTLIGFAGRRVIEGTISEKLPEDFQRAEFLLEHGFLDMIVQRDQMRQVLAELLQVHSLHEPAQKIDVATDLQSGIWKIGLTAAARKDIEATLTPADQVVVERSGSACLELIRAKDRPNIEGYLKIIFDASLELHGDRLYADDPAIWGGIAILNGRPVTVIGHHKGMDFQENSRTNFAMAHPEGYRKMMRLVEQAEKFARPIIYLIDTPGAYCGVGAEERGVGEAIARCLRDTMTTRVPVVSIVIGEGGSGGALALSVCDRLAMLSNGIFSVISPRGFASLLWKDASREMEAADVARITAKDLYELGICDVVIPEPGAGAHAEPEKTGLGIKTFIEESLAELETMELTERLEERYNKFRRIGVFSE